MSEALAQLVAQSQTANQGPWNERTGIPSIDNPGRLPFMIPLAPNLRQNPEDMFTPQQNFARNAPWSRQGPYVTQLNDVEEGMFQRWMQQNGISPQDANPKSGYDMRGFWKAMQLGLPEAKTATNPNDQMRHFPDIWKTPYGATFSNESQYAQPNAPRWNEQGNYVTPSGQLMFNDTLGEWQRFVKP